LYRYGGEEFAVLFSGEQLNNALPLLERWREQIARRTWREEGLHVTFSAGLGEWSLESQEQLVMRVDEALYKAKQEGKNRIITTNG
ncbi:GGDEF domain-containing protein, partial [Salmonella enterica subsp. enterica serovar Kentucky]|nr:GGDEF domain-containing protein [Salmonella enterica subsp. enterica serovar Kentucky]